MEAVTLTPDIRHLIQTTFRHQQDHAPQVARSAYRDRARKLDKMLRYLQEPRNLEALHRAMQRDLRKPEVEVLASELGIVEGHLRFVRRHLRAWMRPRRVSTPVPMAGTSSFVHYEPKGNALILAPWNYPFNLAIVPLIYAIAAGNTAIVKPSEMSPNVSGFISRLVGDLFDDREVAVFEGDASVAQGLLDLPFNHVYFTGSPKIGKQVMKAAARHLASVTLELGGKSPAIIDRSADPRSSARQTVWGKCFNTGQTCIAPDYLLVHESLAEPFLQAYAETVRSFYDPDGRGVQLSPDYGRIINENHFDRLQDLLHDALDKGAEVALGGELDREDLFIAPTLLSGVTPDMRIMQEEIFGPILPVLTYQSREEAVGIIRRQPKPLTMYIQSKNRKNTRYFIDHTSAGGTLINEYLLGYSNPYLPFGGINNSGIGNSLGHHGFLAFSNERSVLKRQWGSLSMAYPPYSKRIVRLLRWLYRLY